jgi:flagellar basal body-associated protein FliL
MSEAAAADAENAEVAPKPKRNMMGLLVGINSVLGLATLGFLAWQVTHPPAPPPAPAADEKHGEGAAAGGEHGAAKPAGGEHGAAKPAAGEHGAPAAGGEHGAPAAGAGPAINAPGVMVPLGEFVVRLPASDGDRYGRFAFEVLVRSADEGEQVKARLPELRDRFIMVLSDLTLDAVRGKAELDVIKLRLFKELQGSAVGQVVRALYVTEFVVQ